MTSGEHPDRGEQQQQRVETGQDFDASLIAVLEISPYDLAVLKDCLNDQKFIPRALTKKTSRPLPTDPA